MPPIDLTIASGAHVSHFLQPSLGFTKHECYPSAILRLFDPAAPYKAWSRGHCLSQLTKLVSSGSSINTLGFTGGVNASNFSIL